ncbi:MAG: aminopeptidase [Sphaerochaetaceae bacterium]
MEIQQRYINFIITDTLQLQAGEALSINASRSHFDFAQDLAQQAVETTLLPVHLVIIDAGKPKEVHTYDPQITKQYTDPPLRSVLLRIDDTEHRSLELHQELEQISQSPALLQQGGNLGSPQLNQPVAPWSVIPVPGPLWALQILGDQATKTDLWKLFDTILFQQEPWIEALSVLKQRMRELNRLELVRLQLKGPNIDLRLDIVEQSRFRCGLHTLNDGREFVPYLPPFRLSSLLNRDGASGTFSSSEPFYLFGKLIEKARFTFFQGELIDVDAAQGKEVLTQAFGLDDGASRLSEISLVEADNPYAAFRKPTGYQGFDACRTNSLVFGMGEASHIEALAQYDDEDDLQRCTGCNTSLLHLRIPIGALDVTGYDELDDEIEIMRNGHFVL